MTQPHIYLGVDPGQTGGWGIVDSKGDYVAADRWRDGVTTLRALAPYAPSVLACALERTSLFPRQSRGFLVQMQSLLTSAGRWYQILEFLRIPYHLVHPQTWQAACGLYHWQQRRRRTKSADPNSSPTLTPWDLAAQLWPQAGIRGPTQSGIAVGLLLADYGRRVVPPPITKTGASRAQAQGRKAQRRHPSSS